MFFREIQFHFQEIKLNLGYVWFDGGEGWGGVLIVGREKEDIPIKYMFGLNNERDGEKF